MQMECLNEMPHGTPNYMSAGMTNELLNEMSDGFSNIIPQRISKGMQNLLPNEIPNSPKISYAISEKTPKGMPYEMLNGMPKCILNWLLDGMSKEEQKINEG